MAFTVHAQQRIDTELNWNLYNPVLRENEIVFSKLTNGQLAMKCGDGESTYAELPYTILYGTSGSGQGGTSPIAYVEKNGSVTTISITDINGTTIAEVYDGEQGVPGIQGNTPVKGVDYWTASDRQEIIDELLETIVNVAEVGQ